MLFIDDKIQKIIFVNIEKRQFSKKTLILKVTSSEEHFKRSTNSLKIIVEDKESQTKYT